MRDLLIMQERLDSLPPEARAYALVSLLAWIVTLLAGRMIAYL